MEAAGPAFTDPAYRVAMDDEWISRPVSYESWAQGADLAVTLDQHLYPALLPLIQGYSRDNGIDVAVQEGTCGISAGKLEQKHADIGGFCCPAGFGDRLPGLRYHTLGVASIALLVHPDNPVSDISVDQARRLFQGRITYWRELPGGDPFDEPVRPIARLHCKARPGHWRLILDNEDQFSPRLTEVSTIPDMITGVAKTPNAIGYETLWMTVQFADKGRVKELLVDGVSPGDEEAVVSGRYPFYRTYNITTWEGAAANGEADRLVAWLKENFGRIDRRYGLLSADRLRAHGWRFQGDELIGEPGSDAPSVVTWLREWQAGNLGGGLACRASAGAEAP